MIVSRVESGKPVLIPEELLAALGVKAGDEVAIELVGDGILVVPASASPDPFLNNFSTFTEWASEEDCRAFADL